MLNCRRPVVVLLLMALTLTVSVAAQEPDTPGSVLRARFTEPQDGTPISHNTLYASAHRDLWKIDPYTGDATFIGGIGYQGTDIAFDGQTLYGVDFSKLLLIDPTTGSGTVVGHIGFNGVNALIVAPDGTMYAGTLDGEFLRIDKSTGAGTLIGYYGYGLASSGDIAVRSDGKAFATVRRHGYHSDWLVEVDLDTGTATPVGDLGEGSVYGLDFKDWGLYGVTDYGHLLSIDPETAESTRIATFSADFWGMSTSGPALIGSITSPDDGYSTGPATLPILATASYPGGQAVTKVEFYARQDGAWSSLGSAESSPYWSYWETPPNLESQQVLLRIDVLGRDLEGRLQRASYAGGVRRLNYVRSIDNVDVTENWVGGRAYLNQRSLNDDGLGDAKCNVSSVAMVLAMEGYIDSDHLSMAEEADEMWSDVWPNPGVAKVHQVLKDRIPTAAKTGPITHTLGWSNLKALIDEGHPVIVDSRPGAVTQYGHYVVAVGYREEGVEQAFIAYDPFGYWRGTYQSYFYNTRHPASHVGKWVYYDFEDFTGSEVYLIAAVAPESAQQLHRSQGRTALDWPRRTLAKTRSSDLAPPDVVSDEPRLTGLFDGRNLLTITYLPAILK